MTSTSNTSSDDDTQRDVRFLTFLSIAAPSELPDEISASIKLGLAKQYDDPPVVQTETVLRQNCTKHRLRQMLYWPDKDDATLYPVLIRGPPKEAPDNHPSRKVQITFLMALFLKHVKDRNFIESFICAGGLQELVPLLNHENLHLRGQAMETCTLLTDEELFPWHEEPRENSSIEKAMHQCMLELAKSNLIKNLVKNISPKNSSEETFPGGRGHALRLFAFFVSWLRVRHCPGNMLRLSSELLAVLETVGMGKESDVNFKNYTTEDVRLAKTLWEDFSRFGDAESKVTESTPRGLPSTLNSHTDDSVDTAQVVLSINTDDSFTVVDERNTVSESSSDVGANNQTSSNGQRSGITNADLGEFFKTKGNAAYQKKQYTLAIETYSSAIDSEVSYHRLLDEAPRRVVYHANRAAAYLARGASSDAGVNSCDEFGVLESRSFQTDFAGTSGGDQSSINDTYLKSSLAHAEAALLDCEAALEMQNGHVKARFRKAMALWRLGRGDEAKENAEKALLSADDNATEYEARSLLELITQPYKHPRSDGELIDELIDAKKEEKEGDTTTEEESEQGVLFAATSLTAADEKARANFVSPKTNALVFGSSGDGDKGIDSLSAAVSAIGVEGDDLYDLD